MYVNTPSHTFSFATCMLYISCFIEKNKYQKNTQNAENMLVSNNLVDKTKGNSYSPLSIKLETYVKSVKMYINTTDVRIKTCKTTITVGKTRICSEHIIDYVYGDANMYSRTYSCTCKTEENTALYFCISKCRYWKRHKYVNHRWYNGKQNLYKKCINTYIKIMYVQKVTTSKKGRSPCITQYYLYPLTVP